jgi:predicted ATPase
VEWSVGLLEDAERSLLEVVAVFVDGWTIGAAAQVAGLGEDRALDLSEELARHSLIYVNSTGLGPRSRMLETVREFVAERLAARPDAVEVGRRHAEYYRALAEQADRPLRGPGQSQWLERLQAEAGNLAAWVRWYLAHDAGPLPHLFRILWPFWFLGDHMREVRPWVGQLLSTVDLLDPRPGRADMDGAGGGARGGRRRGGARGGPAPGTAAAGDRGPRPACGIPAGHGLVLANHRRFRRSLAGSGT